MNKGNWGKLRAFFDLKTSDGFIIKGFKIVEGINGLFVGISAGANVLASERWINENNPDGVVVTILCDRGERYFSILGE